MGMLQNKNGCLKTESLAMSIAGRLGLAKLRWSLRRLHVPVRKTDLVLEVGAGGNPYPRANVLLDAMESTIERNEQDLINDRPLVLGLCEELPFKDKSFDFVIASHVLEHTDNPKKFLNELMRVGKAGYIETPEGWFEKMCAFTYHRLEVSDVSGKLYIRKKKSWKPDEISLFWDSKLSKSKSFTSFLRVNPDLNHLRFYWNDKIEYEIINPECDATWLYPEEAKKNLLARQKATTGLISLIRSKYLALRRAIFSQTSRNAHINIYSVLRCPTCHGEDLVRIGSDSLRCNHCSTCYEIVGQVPRLFPKEIDGFNRERAILMNEL